jgi:hypothetical protein
MKIKITQSSCHRNGVSGEAFHAVLFDYKDDGFRETKKMVATIFEECGFCAVLEIAPLSNPEIGVRFAHGNSWRGDYFESELRRQIKDLDEAEMEDLINRMKNNSL